MSDKAPSHFRMGRDDDSSDMLLREELIQKRMDKLARKITLVAVLIPVLIAIVLVLAYLDLTQRVMRFHDTGSTEVQALATHIEDRFSSLSVKQAKLEALAQKTDAAVKTSNEKAAQQLKALEKRINTSITQIKQTQTGTQTLEKAIEKINRSLAPIRKDVKTVTSKLASVDATVGKELKHINGSLADFNEILADLNKRIEQNMAQVAQLQKETAKLSEESLDKPALRIALDEEKKIYRQMISLITKNLEGKLEALRKQIETINQQRQNHTEKSTRATPPSSASEKASVSPRPGQIVEQNLR